MAAPVLPATSGNLAEQLLGVWWLLSREDWTKEGERRIDPMLGENPMGILTFTHDHFAAQFMKRDRSTTDAMNPQTTQTGKNNTAAVNGYDAYFGTYAVDEAAGRTIQTLLGSINPSNVGMTVHRDMRVQDGKLMIQLETTTASGESIIRTLMWERMR